MNSEATEQEREAVPGARVYWVVFGTLAAILIALYVLPIVHVYRTREVGQMIALRGGLRAYYFEYHEAPKGDNQTIIHTLQGDNPRKIMFFDIDPKHISPQGEFLDPWGTPYHIDVSDPKNPKVYSFGPNKRDDGGTGDDVVSWR